MSWKQNRGEMLANEKTIVWRINDLIQYPWVREGYLDFTDRKKIPKNRISQIERAGEILVGYAELEDDAPPSFIDQSSGRKYFYRRTFIVRKNDYEAYKKLGIYPSEAVETSTIQPKMVGNSPTKKKNKRADCS